MPGGVMIRSLRMNQEVVNFVGGFLMTETHSAICHGPWTLIETGELKGRTVTLIFY
jgi:protease I